MYHKTLIILNYLYHVTVISCIYYTDTTVYLYNQSHDLCQYTQCRGQDSTLQGGAKALFLAFHSLSNLVPLHPPLWLVSFYISCFKMLYICKYVFIRARPCLLLCGRKRAWLILHGARDVADAGRHFSHSPFSKWLCFQNILPHKPSVRFINHLIRKGIGK